jgi:uncharacterized protein YqiB (DUF1249 family)
MDLNQKNYAMLQNLIPVLPEAATSIVAVAGFAPLHIDIVFRDRGTTMISLCRYCAGVNNIV